MQFQHDSWEALDPAQLQDDMAKHDKHYRNSPRGRVFQVLNLHTKYEILHVVSNRLRPCPASPER